MSGTAIVYHQHKNYVSKTFFNTSSGGISPPLATLYTNVFREVFFFGTCASSVEKTTIYPKIRISPKYGWSGLLSSVRYIDFLSRLSCLIALVRVAKVFVPLPTNLVCPINLLSCA